MEFWYAAWAFIAVFAFEIYALLEIFPDVTLLKIVKSE